MAEWVRLTASIRPNVTVLTNSRPKAPFGAWPPGFRSALAIQPRCEPSVTSQALHTELRPGREQHPGDVDPVGSTGRWGQVSAALDRMPSGFVPVSVHTPSFDVGEVGAVTKW